jgi:hypothetical protein
MGGGASTSGPDSEIRKAPGQRIMSKQAVSSFKDIMARDTAATKLDESASLMERMSPYANIGKQIGSFSRQKQLEQLAQGGEPVTDERGRTVGVVSEGRFGKTYTGQSQFDPFSQGRPEGGREDVPTSTATASTPETEEAPTSMAMLPGETPSQYRRRVRRYGGGTIVEGGGVLYK